MDTYNISIDKKFTYHIHLFYLRTHNVWDYINICTHNYKYIRRQCNYGSKHNIKYRTIIYDKYKKDPCYALCMSLVITIWANSFYITHIINYI